MSLSAWSCPQGFRSARPEFRFLGSPGFSAITSHRPAFPVKIGTMTGTAVLPDPALHRAPNGNPRATHSLSAQALHSERPTDIRLSSGQSWLLRYLTSQS